MMIEGNDFNNVQAISAYLQSFKAETDRRLKRLEDSERKMLEINNKLDKTLSTLGFTVNSIDSQVNRLVVNVEAIGSSIDLRFEKVNSRIDAINDRIDESERAPVEELKAYKHIFITALISSLAGIFVGYIINVM